MVLIFPALVGILVQFGPQALDVESTVRVSPK